jgi:hypothetical protein
MTGAATAGVRTAETPNPAKPKSSIVREHAEPPSTKLTPTGELFLVEREAA